MLGWGFLRLLLCLLSRGVIHVRNCWLNTLYRIFWETKYGRFTTLNIPKCEQVTLLVCPLRILVIPSMRRQGNVQSFKTYMFRFWAFCMNATPARRVTPPWDVYMVNCVTPADRDTPPSRPGNTHLSCKRDQDKIRNYMDRWVTLLKRVTSPTWGPPPPYNRPLMLPWNLIKWQFLILKNESGRTFTHFRNK